MKISISKHGEHRLKVLVGDAVVANVLYVSVDGSRVYLDLYADEVAIAPAAQKLLEKTDQGTVYWSADPRNQYLHAPQIVAESLGRELDSQRSLLRETERECDDLQTELQATQKRLRAALLQGGRTRKPAPRKSRTKRSKASRRSRAR